MRRNHNKRTLFNKIAAMAMGVAALGMGAPKVNASTVESNNTTQSQSKKDAIQEKHTPIRPVSMKNDLFGNGDANPFKHQRKGVLNQRQYRKWLRSNPQMRNSKKSK